MGLLDIAVAAARAGFSVAGDVKQPVTIKSSPTVGAHDTTTDTTPVTYASTQTVQAVVYDDSEVSLRNTSTLKNTSKAVLVQGADLTTPPTYESAVEYKGKAWEVFMVEQDPAAATYTLGIRS